MRITILPLCLLAFLFAFPNQAFVAQANAATITVNSDDDLVFGTNGFCTLREAITNANNNNQSGGTDCAAGSGADTIVFDAARLTNQTITLDQRNGEFSITSDMTITNTVANLSVSGGGNRRVFNIQSAAAIVAMTGFRIIGGNGSGTVGATIADGGAILNIGNLTLNSMLVQNNTARSGGGISTSGTGSSLTINGGSILSNTATRTGGGINGSGSIVNLTNADVSSNMAAGSGGGGIFASDGTLNITGGSITRNSAFNGVGGGFGVNGTTVTLTNASITTNRADGSSGGGGAMYIVGGGSTITNSTLSGNTGTRTGGGIYFNGAGTHSITGTTLSGNTTGIGAGSSLYSGGGGLVNASATVNISNSTVSGNSSGCDCGGGGIITFGSGTTNLRNVTVAGNRALDGSGGGIRTFSPGTTNAGNTLVADNTATTNPDVSGAIVSQGFNLVRNRGTSTGYVGTDLPDGSNPMLQALGNNGGLTQTHRLLAGSAAIETGSNALAVNPASGAALTTDQRGAGFPRIVDADGNGTAAVDIGAFEFQQVGGIATISGTIRYGITPANQPQQFVSGVLLSATGASSVSANSNAGTGAYLLNGLTPGGIYTVTPSKTGNINGITAFSATLVLRCAAAGNGCALTDNQKLAADSDGNNSITAFDATQILRFVAAGTQTINTGQVGNWKFNAVSRSYNPLSASQTNQDFDAILVGDVSGGWIP